MVGGMSEQAPEPPTEHDHEHEHDDWLVDEMSEESFPDSDPPSTWAGRDRPPARD